MVDEKSDIIPLNWSVNYKNIPILTIQEEKDLFNKYHQGDLEAAYKLVLHHLRFVDYVISTKNIPSTNMLWDDLFQEGAIQLMKCVKTFDVNKEVKFATFARYHIEHAISMYLIKYGSVFTVPTSKAEIKLSRNLQKGLQKRLAIVGKDTVSHNDIMAVCSDLSIDVHKGVDFYNKNNIVTDIISEDGESLDYYEILPSEYCVEEEIYQDEKSQIDITDYIGCLSDREKDILYNRYVYDQKLTLSELSKKHSVSIERVRQIEKSAIAKLKSSITG